MRRYILSLIAVLFFLKLNAENIFFTGELVNDNLYTQKVLNIYRFGINSSIKYDGFLYGGCAIDYFLTSKWNAEIYAGGLINNDIDYSYSIGMKYWFKSKNCKNGLYPFVGIFYGKKGIIFDGETVNNVIIWETNHYSFIETPIGIGYTTKYGLEASFILGYAFYFERSIGTPSVEFKLGWRFNFKKEKDAKPK